MPTEFEDILVFSLMEERIMRAGNGIGRTAMGLLLVVAVLFASLSSLNFANAATVNPQITVGITSVGTGEIRFDVNGNDSSANMVQVVPGTNLYWAVAFNDANISNVRVREDATGLLSDIKPGQPVQWGFAPRVEPYVIGFFPQDQNGANTEQNVFIKVYSRPTELTATPLEAVANETVVSIIPFNLPAATAKYVFTPGAGITPIDMGSNAGLSFQYTVPGRYTPSVQLFNAAGALITTAEAPSVLVKFANPGIQASNNAPMVGEEVEFIATGMDYLNSDSNIIWSWTDNTGNHEYNSADAFRKGQQASPNVFRWTYSAATPAGQTWPVSVRFEQGGSAGFDNVGSAQTQVTVKAPAQQPAGTISLTMVNTAKENEEVSITITANNVVDGEYAVQMSGLPGVGPYNPVQDPAVVKTRQGANVTMVVKYAFPVGSFTVKAQLDQALNGTWQSDVARDSKPITVTAGNPNPNPQPDAPKIDLGAPKTVAINNMTTIQISVTNVIDGKFAIRLLGLPSGEYNPSVDPTVVRTPIQGGYVYNVPFKFSSVGSFGLIAQLDVNDGTAWTQNVSVDSATVQVGMNMVFAPLIVKAPEQVQITASTTTIKSGIEFEMTAQHGTGNEAQFIWSFGDGRGEYNSTVGASRGEQNAPNKVKFTPGRKGTFTVTLSIDENVNGSWQRTGIGSFTFEAK